MCNANLFIVWKCIFIWPRRHRRSRARSVALFVLLALLISCLCLRKHQHFVYAVRRKRKIGKSNLLREHLAYLYLLLLLFLRSHKLSFILVFFCFRFFFWKKIQATCTRFSPGVVVVVFKSCAQREGAWKIKQNESEIYIYHIYRYRYIQIGGSGSISIFPLHSNSKANMGQG